MKRSRSKKPKVAFDTAVLLHALLLGDAKAQGLRQAWQTAACIPLINAAMAQDLMRALAYPGLKLNATQQHELLSDFLPFAEVVVEMRSRARPALLLARAADCLVSDCPAIRAAFARAKLAPCRLLGSEEFVFGL